MTRPSMLLLDEPSLGLAPMLVQEILLIIRATKQEQQVTVLVVEHNVNMALSAAEYAYVLETGNVILRGPVAELRENDSVRTS